jgi:hypothetical protein
MYEDDYRYFVNVPILGWKYYELVQSRNKYKANKEIEFSRYNLEFKL